MTVLSLEKLEQEKSDLNENYIVLTSVYVCVCYL